MTEEPDTMLNITLNGKPRTFSPGASLRQMLNELNLDPSRVAVEHNGAVVVRERFDDTALKNGDRLEVIQFVGGG